MVTLERIWAAPYTELVAVLASKLEAVPDDINIARELVARIYYRTSLLNKEDAILLTNPSFREIMSNANIKTFKTKYTNLQISSLGLDISKSTLRYEKEVIAMMYSYVTEPTLYVYTSRSGRIQARDPVTLKLRGCSWVGYLKVFQRLLYFDNKIFSADAYGKFFYIDITTGKRTDVDVTPDTSGTTHMHGPFLMNGRIYIIYGELMVYHQGKLFRCGQGQEYRDLKGITFDEKSEAIITYYESNSYDFVVTKPNVEPHTVTLKDDLLMSHGGYFYSVNKGHVSISDNSGNYLGTFENLDTQFVVDIIPGDVGNCFVATNDETPYSKIFEYTLQGSFIRVFKLEDPYRAGFSSMFFCAGRLIVYNVESGLLSIAADGSDDTYSCPGDFYTPSFAYSE
jgi:hypothetical protein